MDLLIACACKKTRMFYHRQSLLFDASYERQKIFHHHFCRNPSVQYLWDRTLIPGNEYEELI